MRTPRRHSAELLDRAVQRIRLALRSLRHAPGFFIAAAITLALGIGLATAVFTVANAMALRRLPVHDQNHIVVLWGRTLDGRFDNYPIDAAADFARQSRALRQAAYFAWFGAAPIPIRDGDRVSQLRRALVSGNFFDVLGARATLGRALRPADDSPGAAPVAVLSYASLAAAVRRRSTRPRPLAGALRRHPYLHHRRRDAAGSRVSGRHRVLGADRAFAAAVGGEGRRLRRRGPARARCIAGRRSRSTLGLLHQAAGIGLGARPARGGAHPAGPRARRYEAGADRVRHRGRAAAAHHLRERRQPAARAGARTCARDRRATRARRRPTDDRHATAHGERAARHCRRRARRGRGRGARCTCSSRSHRPALRAWTRSE